MILVTEKPSLGSVNKVCIVLHFVLQALKWGKDMVAMSGSGSGYSQTAIIIPYMHSIIYHIPTMMRKHGSLRHYSGQGISISISGIC